MKIFGREPAVIVATLIALAQAVWIFVAQDSTINTVDVEAILLPILTVVGGLITRSRVFSVKTVKDAGYTPEQLKARAEDPHIQPVE